MSAPTVRVREVELRVRDCTSRLPFRFGAATITWAPLLTARVTAEVDGELARGHSADLMMPRWFDKDPRCSIADNVTDLAESAQRAARAFVEARPGTVWGLWRSAYASRAGAGLTLVHGFGVALIERALLDAVCRAAGRPFYRALQEDLFGFRPGEVHAELEGWDLAASLPDEPAGSVLVRHTIGLLDPLRRRDADGAPDMHRVDDGLPETLEEDVRSYGLRAFKVKIGGDPEADARRLDELASFLSTAVHGDFLVTLDANEQYADLASLERLLERASPAFVDRIAYVEQPFSRERTFDVPVEGFAKDLLIDEADGNPDDFARALDLGYRGVSVKNCKGVFRTLLNRGLCERRPGAFQSAEDLTNLPVLALQQDLTTVTTLGLPHVERNGHHYFRGLDHLPPEEARGALAAHPELYRSSGDGAFLRIENGELDLSSLAGPGYGYSCEIDFEARTRLEDWTPPAGEAR